jgi:glycosyltransferase involved in cell wall biosynthesis
MHILIVTQYFWPENFRINDIALGLHERGHEVTVYTGKPNYPEGHFHRGYGFFRRAREDWNGIRIIRVPLLPRGTSRALQLALNYLSFALCACLLAPFRVRGAFDAILVYQPSPMTVGLPALVLKKLKRAPILFWVQDPWPETLFATGAVHSSWILRAIERLARFIYHSCDLVLVQSRAFIEPIRARGIPQSRIAYFPNSAEPFYRPLALEPVPSEGHELPPGFRLMYAGNIGAAQDFETILAAAERLAGQPDLHWIVLGEGRAFTFVAREVERRRLGGRVHLLGRRPAQAMPRYFALADALLVTLRRDPMLALTIPSRLQSYLACARPILAALDGEGARVVREANAGLVCPPGDPEALAAAALALYRMPESDRRALGECGRRYFEQHFERNRLLAQLEGWLRDPHSRAE